MQKLPGIFGTLQLNGSVTSPICFIHLPDLPSPGTLIALGEQDPVYYRVINAMMIVKPLNEMTLAAISERAEAGEQINTLSDKCIVFVEPYDPDHDLGAL